MKTVYDLNRNELDELKWSYFDQLLNEDEDILGDISLPEKIPDEVIFEHYDGIVFSNDDFFCNLIEKEDKK